MSKTNTNPRDVCYFKNLICKKTRWPSFKANYKIHFLMVQTFCRFFQLNRTVKKKKREVFHKTFKYTQWSVARPHLNTVHTIHC